MVVQTVDRYGVEGPALDTKDSWIRLGLTGPDQYGLIELDIEEVGTVGLHFRGNSLQIVYNGKHFGDLHFPQPAVVTTRNQQ